MNKLSLAIIETTAAEVLSADEFAKFKQLEQRILDSGKAFFYTVGRALLEISKERLYRVQFDTFEDYVEESLGIKERYAHYLVKGAEVVENISQLASGYPLPTAETQVRELAAFEPHDQATIWRDACDSGYVEVGKVPPAKLVQKFADERRALLEDSGALPPKRKPKALPAAPEEKVTKKPNNEWYTPERYVNAVRDVLGGAIELDPASCSEAQQVIQAERYYTAEDDGLSCPWVAKSLFLNPPYETKLVGPFVQRLIQARENMDVDEAILLVNVRPDSPWFRLLLDQFDAVFCFVDHRISFRRPVGVEIEVPEPDDLEDADDEEVAETKKMALNGFFPSTFVYFGDDSREFVERFKEFGPIFTMQRRDHEDIDDLPEG